MEKMFVHHRLVDNSEFCDSGDELSIPQLNRHLTMALFFTKLGAAQARPVREKLNFVLASPQRREHLLAELKENLQT